LQLAQRIRPLPTTSRGGGIVLDDLVARRCQNNVFQRNLPAILYVLRDSKVVVSLGSTFRPASSYQILDQVHIEETRLQNEYADLFLQQQIPVLREGIGHGTPNGIRHYVEFLRGQDIQLPFMALGPMAADHAGSFDVLAAGVGAALMSDYAYLGIIQTITSQEHSGGVPNSVALLDGVASARVVADIVNADRGVRRPKSPHRNASGGVCNLCDATR
jgi:phosphomethylpyrimidine synthase